MGMAMVMEIPFQSNHRFEIEIPIAFTFAENIILTANSELLIYGTVGLLKIISLINF